MANPRYTKGKFVVVVNIQHLEGINPQAQAVYMRLCKFANDTGKCFPSVTKIAKVTRMSKPTVLKYIDVLCTYGLVERESRFKASVQQSNEYYLPILEGKKSLPPSKKSLPPGKRNGPPPVKEVDTELYPDELYNISTNVDILEADASGGSDVLTDDISSEQENEQGPTPSSGDPLPFPRSMNKWTPQQIQELDDLLDALKEYSEELMILRDNKEERIFGRNILSAKEFGALAEKLGKTRLETAKHIMHSSQQVEYVKGGIAAGPRDIYLRRVDILNARNKQQNKNGDQDYSQREHLFWNSHCGPDVVGRILSLPEAERRSLATELHRKYKQFNNIRDDNRFKLERLQSIHKHIIEQTKTA